MGGSYRILNDSISSGLTSFVQITSRAQRKRRYPTQPCLRRSLQETCMLSLDDVPACRIWLCPAYVSIGSHPNTRWNTTQRPTLRRYVQYVCMYRPETRKTYLVSSDGDLSSDF